MQGLGDLAKIVIGLGLGLIVIGLLMLGMSRLFARGGWLPGDIIVRKPGFTFAFPIVTSLVLSILVTLVLAFVAWLQRK